MSSSTDWVIVGGTALISTGAAKGRVIEVLSVVVVVVVVVVVFVMLAVSAVVVALKLAAAKTVAATAAAAAGGVRELAWRREATMPLSHH